LKRFLIEIISIPNLFIFIEDKYGIIASMVLMGLAIVLIIYIYLLLRKGRLQQIVVNNVVADKVSNPIFPDANLGVKDDEEINVSLHETNAFSRYNYSFIARLHLAPKESQARFSTLKNFLMKYEGMKVKKTWRYEIFKLNKEIIAKIWLYGNSIDVYNNLDESLLEDIEFEKKDDKLMHEQTPMMCKVLNDLNLRRLIKAFETKLSENKIIENFEEKDYQVGYISKEELLQMELIKIKIHKKKTS